MSIHLVAYEGKGYLANTHWGNRHSFTSHGLNNNNIGTNSSWYNYYSTGWNSYQSVAMANLYFDSNSWTLSHSSKSFITSVKQMLLSTSAWNNIMVIVLKMLTTASRIIYLGNSSQSLAEVTENRLHHRSAKMMKFSILWIKNKRFTMWCVYSNAPNVFSMSQK